MSKYNSILDINEILNDYSQDIQESITNKAQSIAKEAQSKLKSTSPVNQKNTSHRGKYAKGWKVKEKKGQGFVNCIIYNATDYRLTHLLEKGHLTRNGKKTQPIKHIEPVEKEFCGKFEDEVKKIIKNGG